MKKPFYSCIAFIIVICLLGTMAGCYNVTSLTIKDQMFFQVKDSAEVSYGNRTVCLYHNEKYWHIQDITLTQDEIHFSDIALTKKPVDSTDGAIVIYLEFSFEYTPVTGEPGSIDISRIRKIELQHYSSGKTIFASGVAGGIVLILTLICVCSLTKSSCPFVYVYENGEYHFTGEIFSGAVFPGEERDDYLLLPSVDTENNEYIVRIANMIKNEVQYNNCAELIVYDHPGDTTIMVDKYGSPHSITTPIPPLTAKNSYSEDILPFLEQKNDEQIYYSIQKTKNDLMEQIILTFQRPPGTARGKLLLKAKNSFWLDYAYRAYFYQMGDYYEKFYEKRMNMKKTNGKWQKDQGIPLALSVMTEKGWEYVDDYNLPGPMAFRDDILSLDLNDLPPGETLTLKLEAGMNFWEIDYIAMDYSENDTMVQTLIPSTSAVTEKNESVSAELLASDNVYYVQDSFGDSVTITYRIPPEIEGMTRTCVLHTRGYYLMTLNPQPEGDADLMELMKLKEPRAFTKFSSHLYDSIQQSIE